MLTIAELQAYLAEQAKATPAPNVGVSTTPNSSNNVSHIINGSPLQDLIPVDDSWTNNIIQGMPNYATATPDPNATPSPAPVQNPASLISSQGSLTVSGVPATTKTGKFTVYGKAQPFANVKATVDVTIENAQSAGTVGSMQLIASAIAESTTRKYTVGQAVADKNGAFTMDVSLPQPGEYIVEFTSGSDYMRYGVTYESEEAAEPLPTAAPLPTMQPVEEEGGFSFMPIVIGGALIVVAAIVYGVYIYNRRREEEEEEEALDEEEELLRERMNQQRVRRAQQDAKPAAPAASAPRMPQNQAGQMPSYMKQAQQPQQTASGASPYAKPVDASAAPEMPKAPVMPKAPEMPAAPVVPKAPEMPAAPVMPKAPEMPAAPVMPKAPEMPKAPVAPTAPAVQEEASSEAAPRRRRRPPVDPNA